MSCSTEDNLIVVFDYQQQEEVQEISLPFPEELPTQALSFNQKWVLVGSNKGIIRLFDLHQEKKDDQAKTFVEGASIKMKSATPIVQIKRMAQGDKRTGNQNVFVALAASGQIKIFSIN